LIINYPRESTYTTKTKIDEILKPLLSDDWFRIAVRSIVKKITRDLDPMVEKFRKQYRAAQRELQMAQDELSAQRNNRQSQKLNNKRNALKTKFDKADFHVTRLIEAEKGLGKNKKKKLQDEKNKKIAERAEYKKQLDRVKAEKKEMERGLKREEKKVETLGQEVKGHRILTQTWEEKLKQLQAQESAMSVRAAKWLKLHVLEQLLNKKMKSNPFLQELVNTEEEAEGEREAEALLLLLPKKQEEEEKEEMSTRGSTNGESSEDSGSEKGDEWAKTVGYFRVKKS